LKEGRPHEYPGISSTHFISPLIEDLKTYYNTIAWLMPPVVVNNSFSKTRFHALARGECPWHCSRDTAIIFPFQREDIVNVPELWRKSNGQDVAIRKTIIQMERHPQNLLVEWSFPLNAPRRSTFMLRSNGGTPLSPRSPRRGALSQTLFELWPAFLRMRVFCGGTLARIERVMNLRTAIPAVIEVFCVAMTHVDTCHHVCFVLP
jgi:hypothetical protein